VDKCVFSSIFIFLFRFLGSPDQTIGRMGSKRQHLVTLVISTPRVEQTSTFFWHPTVDESKKDLENQWLAWQDLLLTADVVGQ
jgi:hypothetical protein